MSFRFNQMAKKQQLNFKAGTISKENLTTEEDEVLHRPISTILT
jgi:hypothetical protein